MPTSPAPLTLESPHPTFSVGRRRAVLAAMCLALVLVVAGVSMLNVALPTIARDLGASPSAQLWIADGYTIALAALLLPFGALGDRYGRRGALAAGMVLFVAAALGAAFADSTGVLIAFRGLAGMGAALIMPGTLSTITNVFPPDERARAVGVWAGFAGAGGMLGMLFSGWLLEHHAWGSVFITSAAVGIVALAATLAAVPSSRDEGHPRIDVVGSLLSAAGIGGLVLGIIEGPHRGWADGLTLAGLGVGAVAVVAWTVWSLRVEHPLLDPRLFRLRGFATGSAGLFLQFFAMFGLFLVALQFLQLILGYGTLKASVALLPMAAAMLPLSTVSATLATRYGQRVIAAAGAAITAAGFLVLSTITTSSGYGRFLVAIVVIGVGLAFAMTPATNAIVSSLPRDRQGVASAVNDTARELGAAFGIAVLGSAFNAGYRGEVDGLASSLPGGLGGMVKEGPAYALGVARQLGSGGRAVADAAGQGFVAGMRWSVLIAAGALLLGAAFTWFRAPGAEQPAPVGAAEPEGAGVTAEALALAG